MSPVDFDAKSTWTATRLSQPAAVVDFLYHRDALIYYDHHRGPFVGDFKTHFDARSDEEYIRLEEGESSAARVVFRDLSSWLRDELEDRFQSIESLVAQVDTIDDAKFGSDTGWFDCEFDLAKLNLILQHQRYVLAISQTDRFCNELVVKLSEADCTQLVRDDYYSRLFTSAKNWAAEQKERVESALQCRGGVVFYDAVKYAVPFLRFYPYEVYPTACFVVAIYTKGDAYEVSVGRRPEGLKPCPCGNAEMSMGELCEGFGGGGHQDVGGITLGSYKEAHDVSARVVSILEESVHDFPCP